MGARHGRARQVVERPGAGQAAIALDVRPFMAPALDARTLTPRADIAVVEPPFARLLGAKHTRKGSGAGRIRDPRTGIPTQLRNRAIHLAGQANQNEYIERFNRTYRTEILSNDTY